MPRSLVLVLALASLVAALLGASARAARAQSWPASSLPAASAGRVRVPADPARARGGAEPLVTIVAFSDFECPYCGLVQPTLERLLREHGPDLQLVFRHQPLPFHPNALPAAEASMEALAQGGTAKFWEMHDLLFANPRALRRADLEAYAERLGLDVARFRAALDEHRHRAAIEADLALAARVGNRGTPGFFVNGRPLEGAQPYAAFAAMIEEELALVREGLAGGVPRAEVYARLQAGARERAPERPTRPTRPSPARRPDSTAVYRVPLYDDQPVRGRADALVTIVAFTDFQCPFCRRADTTIAELLRRYRREVRYAVRQNPLPFHADARPAAMALLEARAQRGARGYWAMYDRLMGGEAPALDRASLEAHARAVGLDLARFRRALDEERHAVALRDDQDLARLLGANGTPTFYVNGRVLTGAQPLAVFEALVEEELAKARARVRSGTPRRRVYEAIVAEGALAP